jgi:TPR repeat protein
MRSAALLLLMLSAVSVPAEGGARGRPAPRTPGLISELEAGILSPDPDRRVASLAGIERRAEAGDIEASRWLGFLYLEDRLVGRNVAVAVAYLEPAAAAGDVDAHRALGLLKWRGDEVPRDPRAARRHLETAGRAGDGLACLRLSDILREIGEDPEVVTAWLRRAAAEKVAEAQYQLALEILARTGAIQDRRVAGEARGWLQAAARAGHGEAQYTLAVCYGTGVGGYVDRTAARSWMARAAAGGHTLARMVLGGDRAAD